MNWLPNMKRSLRPSRGRERRRYKRFHTEDFEISCDLGQVVDLSSHGMRILCQKKPAVKIGQKMSFVIAQGTKSLKVRGKIIRVKRVGLRRFETAVHFPSVDPQIADTLEKLGEKGLILKIPTKDSTSHGASGPPQFEMLDPYKVLGVSKDASEETIRTTYRRLAKKFHPDISGHTGCIDKFSKIDSAYKFLRDPEVRRIYDKLMEDEASGAA